MNKLTSSRARTIGAKGGKSAWANISKEERSQRMKALRAKGKQKKV